MPAETVILTTWEIWNFEAGEKSLTDTNNSCHFGAMLHALVVVTTVVSIFFFFVSLVAVFKVFTCCYNGFYTL